MCFAWGLGFVLLSNNSYSALRDSWVRALSRPQYIWCISNSVCCLRSSWADCIENIGTDPSYLIAYTEPKGLDISQASSHARTKTKINVESHKICCLEPDEAQFEPQFSFIWVIVIQHISIEFMACTWSFTSNYAVIHTKS